MLNKREDTRLDRVLGLALSAAFITLTLSFGVTGASAQIPAGYYDTVDTTNAATLRATLHDVIDDHTRFPYTASTTDTWDIVNMADEDPNNMGNIVDLYKNVSYTKIPGGVGAYNREHSWPKSYGFPNDSESNSPYTDTHHLFACDASYNGSRSNKPFRNCDASCQENTTEFTDGRGGGSGVYPGNSNWTTGSFTQGTWEAWDGRKGDVARAIFYMDIRYEGGNHGVTGFAEPDLIVTDNESLIDSSNTGSNESVAYMGMLSVLLQWHAQDPPDSREIWRNEVVYSFQGNRNPFIDHPEWAECLHNNVCGGSGDTTPPANPTGLVAIAGENLVDLSWNANSDSDLAGYHAYRATAPGGPYARITGTLLTNTFYTDNSAIGGTTYYYVVRAVDTSANESGNSGEVSATPTGGGGGGGGSGLVLSEVLYDVSSGDDGFEWVELYNSTGSLINLSGYCLGNGGTDYTYSTVQLSGSVASGATFVIGGPTSSSTNSNPSFDQVFNFSPDFQNSGSAGDGVALFDVACGSVNASTVPIDAVVYGPNNNNNLIDETGSANAPEVGDASAGSSLVRVDMAGSWQITSSPTPNATTLPPPSSNETPVVTITAPGDGSSFGAGASIAFAGTASDTEDGDITANLSWTSNLDGTLGSGGSFSFSLSTGVHTITASVTDSGGLGANDAILVTVVANTAPTVNITAPSNGAAFNEGTSIAFAGTASDSEDGDLTSSLSWTSNLDGSIGSGGSFSAALSVGVHTITVSVTDSGSLSVDDQISITVNAVTPSGGSLLLSEVLYDVSSTDDGLEWVEIYNNDTVAIDLSGFSLGNGGPTYTTSLVQLSGTVQPGATFVVGGPTSSGVNGNPVFDQVFNFNPDFQNSGTTGDGVALFNVPATAVTAATVPIDAVVYGPNNNNSLIDETGFANAPEVGDASPNSSLERLDVAGNWQIQSTPSPNVSLLEAACVVDADCSDGLFCNGTETCNAGVCEAGTAPTCDDGLFCNGTETCNEATDSCDAGPVPTCDDGLFCNGTETCNESTDSCDAGPAPTCDDGLFCNGTETCNESTDSCDAGPAPTCDDGLFCNGTETCNESTDSCDVGAEPCFGGEICNELGDFCEIGASDPVLWMSFRANTSVPGVGTVADEDIVSFNENTGVWTLEFDGSDVGLSSFEIDGLVVLPDGDLLLSFRQAGTVGGISADDSDIVRFTPTSLGSTTAGTFSLYFDGSDVGLSSNGEDIDAFTLDGNGALVVSTQGGFSGTGASGNDEDLFLFTGTVGSSTSGSFSLYFDGSDVDLATSNEEDIDAATLTVSGNLLFSTLGNFSVSGVSGTDEDIAEFAGVYGSGTSGIFSLRQDLTALGIDSSEDVGSLHILE